MPPTDYTRTYPGPEFAALVTPAPNATVLRNTILYDPLITEALTDMSIGAPAGDCIFTFANALPAPDEAQLDAICAAHTGIRVLTTMESAFPVVRDEVAVTEDVNWQTLAEVVTTPSFFTDPGDLANLFGRIVGEYKAVAGGGGELPQLQVCEKVAGLPDEDKISPPADMAAAAAWATFGVSTDVTVRDGYHNTYIVQARLNGAVSFDIKWTTMSMINTKTV
jgi:hypothetical protein